MKIKERTSNELLLENKLIFTEGREGKYLSFFIMHHNQDIQYLCFSTVKQVCFLKNVSVKPLRHSIFAKRVEWSGFVAI